MGLFLQNDGGNEAKIASKVEKATATTKRVKAKVKEMLLGRCKAETVVMLRESVLLGSHLYGVEVLSN